MKYAVLLLVVLVTETWGEDLEVSLGGPVLVSWSNSDQMEKANEPDSATFIKQVIDFHNRVRRLHQVGPLTEDPLLTLTAQAWADHMLKTGVFKRDRSRGNTGENIAYTKTYRTGFHPDGETFAAHWYNEKELYNDIYGREPTESEFTQVCHFTQIVWKATKTIGVGMATYGHRIYVVANYSPPGNSWGEFSTNVRKPLE